MGQPQHDKVHSGLADCTGADHAHLQQHSSSSGCGMQLLQHSDVQLGSAEHTGAGSGVQPAERACGMKQPQHSKGQLGPAECTGAGGAQQPAALECGLKQPQHCKGQAVG